VRLLQNFSAISLASDAQPLDSRPPADWAEDKEGRKGKEKIKPRAHLTMYVQVCGGSLRFSWRVFFLFFGLFFLLIIIVSTFIIGWALG
jgi:hypothetical protein